MLVRNGNSPSHRRESRPILSLRIEAASRECPEPVSLEPFEDSENLSALQRFEATLWAERNKWDLDRRTSGWYSPGKLSKADAARMFARFFPDNPRTERNSLATYRRDGAQ